MDEHQQTHCRSQRKKEVAVSYQVFFHDGKRYRLRAVAPRGNMSPLTFLYLLNAI